MLRSPLVEYITDRFVDTFDKEALRHLLGVDGPASKRRRLMLSSVVGQCKNWLFKRSAVGVDGCIVVVHRVSF